MHGSRARRLVAGAVIAVAFTALPLIAGATSADRTLPAGTKLFVPPPSAGAVRQAADLLAHRDAKNALLIAKMETIPRAVWLTGGTPAEAAKQVKTTLLEADLERAVPVFVVYNIPARDCSQYSAGGAANDAAYDAWVAAIATAIGSHKAVVLLEPDALANLPVFCSTTTDPLAGDPPDANGNYRTPELHPLSAQRLADMNYAVDQLEAQTSTTVYLDAGHSAWHSVGDMARVLYYAGVQRTQGIFLNVSNYQPTPQQDQYGTWISKCLYYGTNLAEGGWRVGHFDYCASQYYPASPNDYSTWALTDAWYAANVDNGPNPPAGPGALAHIVVDTSRNGVQPTWSGPLDWCNPPGRGLGARPTTSTGVPLVDAYLWVKTPGESDGACNRDGNSAGTDSAWGNTVDPAAGAWFPAQALQLAQLANPPLRP
jgi:endoglucanase